MATTRLRQKVGFLEIQKKKQWKPFTFKVTAATYFHYFKDVMAKPREEILLVNVIKVVGSHARGQFPFEVHFRGKGSPWVINANTQEDRVGWMEAVLPGSSALLLQEEIDRPPPPSYARAPSPVPPYPPGGQSYQQQDPLQEQNTLSPTQVDYRPNSPIRRPVSPAHRPVSPAHRPVSPAHQRSFQQRGTAMPVDLNQSWPQASQPQQQSWSQANQRQSQQQSWSQANQSQSQQQSWQPEEYLLPTSLHQQLQHHVSAPFQPLPHLKLTQATMSLPPNLTGQPQPAQQPSSKPKPTKRTTISNGPPKPPPRPLLRKTSTEPTLNSPGLDDPYIIMVPGSPASPEIFAPGHNYMAICDNEEPPGELDFCPIDENNYVIPQPSRSAAKQQVYESTSDPPAAPKEGGLYDMVGEMAQNFSKDQIGLLINMLQQVQGGDKMSSNIGPKPSVYEIQDPPNLLKRALSHAPSLDPENILITDDDESYEPRPDWAKAVTSDSNSDASMLDSLTALEQEALFIPRDKLDDFKQIGEGQFGKVFKATLRQGPEGGIPVAVKTTKKSSSEADKASFMSEMSIMSQMMHPNIVRLYGLVSEDVPSPWIVLEYLPHGDLKGFLMNNKRPVDKLVKYMIDVAMGMHYIAERGLVHRDLAARNILVSDNELCKVADFGLLRELPKDDSIYHSQTNIPCPVRWMPPEAVTDRCFSSASDVWSFGILQWEMFNPGKLPYDKFSNIECVTKVMQGFRLPVPRMCPPIVARIMKACWHKTPAKRPSFLLISTLLTTKVTFSSNK